MSDKKELLLKRQLKTDMKVLVKALDIFSYSYEECKKIGIKDDYLYEDLDKFESLTSRFARISDILTQKVLKSIFLILREDVKTFLDKAHMAEKLEIIDNAENLKAIRDLRNEITHEYCIDDLSGLFKSVLNYSQTLLSIIGKVREYVKDKDLLEPDEKENV